MRIRLLLSILPFLASCSFAFAKGPPSGWNSLEGPSTVALNSCNPKAVWGIVDILTALTVLSSGYVETLGNLETEGTRGRFIAPGAIGAAVFAISASVGFNRADNCGKFRSESPQFFDDFPEPQQELERTADSSTRRDANLITSDELTEVFDRSVFEAIQILRPGWLRRTGFARDLPGLIIDNQRYTSTCPSGTECDAAFEFEILQTMRPGDVETLTLLSASDASTRWGTGYPVGAIEVRTRGR